MTGLMGATLLHRGLDIVEHVLAALDDARDVVGVELRTRLDLLLELDVPVQLLGVESLQGRTGIGHSSIGRTFEG